MNSEKDTVPNNEQILKAISELRTEMKNDIDSLRDEISGLRTETRSEISSLRTEMNAKFEDMRLQMMSFDVRLDRVQSLVHESLTIGYSVRADVGVLREEVSAWAKEVVGLQLKSV